MGFLRKATFVATGGLSGAAGIKANSKKERTAKAMEAQLRLQRKAMKPSRPAPTSATLAPALTFPLANYDGTAPFHLTPRKSGTLNLKGDGNWEFRFRGTTRYMHGGLTRYPMTVTETGPQSCHVIMADKQDPNISWSFDLPSTPAATVSAEVSAQIAELTATTASTKRPIIAPRIQPQIGIADEIAKLGSLRSQGLITDAEFNAQKLKLLGRP